MKYKAVLFDLDGTLLDTLEDIADSMNIILERLNFPVHDISEYKYFVGDGVDDLILRALPYDKRTDVMIKKGIVMMREEYQKRWANKTKPYNGIPEFLKALTNKSIKLAVLSNKPDDFTKKMVDKYFPDIKFSDVSGRVANFPRKPDPKIALNISNAMHIKPNEIIFLGDSNVDMQTAVAAGMFPVGALWGFRTSEELLKSGAKILISEPMDLLKVLN